MPATCPPKAPNGSSLRQPLFAEPMKTVLGILGKLDVAWTRISARDWQSRRPTSPDRGFIECIATTGRSVRLNARKFHNFRPLFGFVGNKLSKLSRRAN